MTDDELGFTTDDNLTPVYIGLTLATVGLLAAIGLSILALHN